MGATNQLCQLRFGKNILQRMGRENSEGDSQFTSKSALGFCGCHVGLCWWQGI